MVCVNSMRARDLVLPGVIAIIAMTVFFFVHPIIRLLFIPGIVIAYMCYILTSHRRMPKVDRVLPVYLLALAWQFIHFSEEYVTGFYERVAELSTLWPGMNVNLILEFNMFAYALFTLAALAMYKGKRAPVVIVWFFAITGVIGNALWHLVFSIIVGGYFPGLYKSFGWESSTLSS